MSTPGVSQYCGYTYQAAGVGHKPRGSPCRTLAPRCLLLPTQQSRGGCLSSSVPSRYCSEELKGCSKGLRLLFLAMCRERRLATLTFLTFSEYCHTVLLHVRILILLSAKAFFGSFLLLCWKSKTMRGVYNNVICCHFPWNEWFLNPGKDAISFMLFTQYCQLNLFIRLVRNFCHGKYYVTKMSHT